MHRGVSAINAPGSAVEGLAISPDLTPSQLFWPHKFNRPWGPFCTFGQILWAILTSFDLYRSKIRINLTCLAPVGPFWPLWPWWPHSTNIDLGALFTKFDLQGVISLLAEIVIQKGSDPVRWWSGIIKDSNLTNHISRQWMKVDLILLQLS